MCAINVRNTRKYLDKTSDNDEDTNSNIPKININITSRLTKDYETF